MTYDPTAYSYPRSWWQVAIDRGMTPNDDGSADMGMLADVGVSIINGCPECEATVAPYNSFKIAADNDYAYCRECASALTETFIPKEEA